jgi:hypothetical protein
MYRWKSSGDCSGIYQQALNSIHFLCSNARKTKDSMFTHEKSLGVGNDELACLDLNYSIELALGRMGVGG